MEKKKPKNHTGLLCDIGELSQLFSDATNLETFLKEMVVLVSDHMKSEVCSVYLFYEETRELVLKATRGLEASSVDRVRLKLNEGLTGYALQKLRPICVKEASKDKHYKYFPDIGEERYESFLAVPIRRGMTRIGVIVVQNSKKDYFDQEDVRVLSAITSQLATTIETTKLFLTIHQKPEEVLPAKETEKLKFIRGKVGSRGLAHATAYIIENESMFEMIRKPEYTRAFSMDEFQKAAKLSETQLEKLQEEIGRKYFDMASLIFTAQILMLKDKEFLGAMTTAIQNGINPPQAIFTIVAKYTNRFKQMENLYFKDRGQDVEDIGKRLLTNLLNIDGGYTVLEDSIVIAKELFASDILKLTTRQVKGIVLLTGGVSSHLSILARSLHIPLVISDHPGLLRIKNGTDMILDAEVGNIYIAPEKEVVSKFREREKALSQACRLNESAKSITKTKDGMKVVLMSNINLISDTTVANALSAEGVGLYRTEFPFLIRNDFPTEEEQFVVYKRLVESLPKKEITFRTLDIGGDKVLSYYDFGKEENPFLGMRSIRFSLRHKDIFSQQIRAILRASAGAGAFTRIMFPMISSLDEFIEAREVYDQCLKDLKKDKIPYNNQVNIGIMVELPSVLEIMDELAREADFFSIGTNDFIQYMLAVDRTNEKVSDFYLPHHPAILRALKKVVDTAEKYKKDVSICGDMVHDARFIPYLLGIGIKKFSVDAQYIPRVRNEIACVDTSYAKKQTDILLMASTVKDTYRFLERRN